MARTRSPTLWMGREEGRETPVRLCIKVPGFGIALDTRPLTRRAGTISACHVWKVRFFVEGSHQGRGYPGMTGYCVALAVPRTPSHL